MVVSLISGTVIAHASSPFAVSGATSSCFLAICQSVNLGQVGGFKI